MFCRVCLCCVLCETCVSRSVQLLTAWLRRPARRLCRQTEALADEFKKVFEAAVQKLREAPAAEPEKAEPQAEEEEEDGEEDGEYEDDDSPMFERHATLHTNTGDVWKVHGADTGRPAGGG